ncbi:MAG: Xaa-Pro peptidase family protein [Abditibacteriaceae bacterium]
MGFALRQLSFSLAEYSRRLTRVQAAMAQQNMEALLVHHRAGLCYLTGMENCYMSAPYAALVPVRGEPVLVASQFEMFNANASSWCEDRETFRVGDDPLQMLARVLTERGFEQARIGVQMSNLTVSQYEQMQQLLPRALWQDASTLLPEIMLVKSAEEIVHLREAGRLSTLGMMAALEEIAIGVTDNEVAAAAYAAMVKNGGEFMCIEPIVTVGPRSGIPHTTFRRTPIEKGDAVFIEVGGCIHRYSAPLMRTACIEPSDEIRHTAAACRDSLSVLIENIKPGTQASHAAREAKAAWKEVSERLIWHGIYGYSVGLGFPPDWNDAPVVITESSEWVFEPGMCFHATTSLRNALQFGLALSETILITESGNEILTGTPRELRAI